MKTLLRTPWYYGWNIVVAGIAAQAVTVGIAIYSFTFWIAHWTEDFEVSRTEVMAIFLVLQLVVALFSPIAGRALDRFSIRYLMLISAVSFAAGLALVTIASSIWEIAVIYGVFMVIGMVFGGIIPAAALVARWFDNRRGMAMGISTTGTSLGGFLMPPIVAYLQQGYGWRDANLMLAALSLVIIALAALIVFDSPDAAGVSHEGKRDGSMSPPAGQSGRVWTVHDALSNRTFWAIGISFLLLSFAVTAVMQNLGPVGDDAGLDPATVSWLISIMALVMIMAKLGVGYLADKFEYRNILTLVLILIIAATAILAFLETSEMTLLAAVIVLGIGMGGLLPLLGVIVADIFGLASFGRMQGMLILVMLPASLGPMMAASVFDSSGSYQMAWIILLAVLAPTALFIRGIKPAPRSM